MTPPSSRPRQHHTLPPPRFGRITSTASGPCHLRPSSCATGGSAVHPMPLVSPNAPSLPTTTPTTTGKVRTSAPSIVLHRTPLPASNLCSVMTRRATQPRRLAPYPSIFKFNYLSKVFSACFHRLQANIDRIEWRFRIMISEAASSPSPNVSSHLMPLHDDCSAVYSDVDQEGFRLTIIECFPRVVRSWSCTLARLPVLRLGGLPRVIGSYTLIGSGRLPHPPDATSH